MSDTKTGRGPIPPTPELDKQAVARAEGHSEDIGAFLEWLGEQGIRLARYGEHDQLLETGFRIEQLLADYFKIDLKKVDQERIALLAWVRAGQEEQG